MTAPMFLFLAGVSVALGDHLEGRWFSVSR